MHISDRLRSELRKRIDQVLDPLDWEDDSSLVRAKSFVTFVRSIVADHISRPPSLGVSVSGDLLATWWDGSPERSLFARYHNDDRIEIIGAVNGSPFRTQALAGALRDALRKVGFSDQALNDTQPEDRI